MPISSSKPKPKKVLVIDDNADLGKAFGKLIKLLGEEVKVVLSGISALETVSSYKPDIIFLDIAMPGMDGYETARRLRELAGSEKIKLIAVTGFGQREYKQRSEKTGFDRHIVKPFSSDDIRKILKEE